MKKLIPILILMVIMLTSCNKAEKQFEKETIYPSDLVTAEEIAPFIGYTPTSSEEQTRIVSTLTFLPSELGSNDIVVIKLRQKNQLQSEEKVKAYFDELKNARGDAFDAELQGVESFIAYPSLHYYNNGFHIEITAGSGSDDLQTALLKNIANLTLEKLNNYQTFSTTSAESQEVDKTE